MTKKQMIKLSQIESSVYGADGLYSRVIKKIEEIGTTESMKLTGKKRQYITLVMRQFKNPEKFDYRPKLDTIIELAERLGVE